MTVPFDPARDLIITRARLRGPLGDVNVRLALDTGATRTLVNQEALLRAGYDPGLSRDYIRIATASNTEYVPLVAVEMIQALGQERANLRIFAHSLPPGAAVDGLLGLDFLRGHRLAIDFRAGIITLD